MGRSRGRLITKRLLYLGLIILGIWWWNCLPEPLFKAHYSTVTEAQNGALLGARIAEDEQWRFPPTDSVPWRFAEAIIHFEDAHFRYHPGFDPTAILRALWQNWQAGEIVSGGSTISMQVIRLARGNPPRTYWEKGTEILRALRLELRYSKDEILALYAAHAPFGGNVVGLDAAAWRYYGLASHQLSWTEVAALAVLPNAPGIIHPGRNQNAFKNKRDRLLATLLTSELIDSLEYRLALKAPLPQEPHALPDIAHHLTQLQDAEMPEQRVQSSINKQWQSRIQTMLDQHLLKWSGNSVHNAAALVMDLEDGAIRAYVGNTSNTKVDGAEINMLHKARSTGSILKPFLYADAFASGQLSPQALVADIPTRFGDFTPKNFDQTYRGACTAAQALQQSLNVPAARVLREMGVPIFLHRLRGYGLQELENDAGYYGLALILGGAEVPAEQIANTYRRWLWAMQGKEETQVYDALGRPLKVMPIPASDPAAIFSTLKIMEGLNRPQEWQNWGANRNIAWKTGTSYGFRDAWAVGTDGRWLVVCWTGNANYEGRPGVIGVETSAPLLFRIMDFLPSSSFFEPPYDWQHPKVICAESGYLAQSHCRFVDTIYGSKSSLKTCSFCKPILLNEAGKRVHRDCGAGPFIDTSWMILSPAMTAYAQRSQTNYQPPPAWSAECESAHEETLEFIYPEQHEVVRRSRDFEGKLGSIILEAGHRLGEVPIFWYVNEEYIGSTQMDHHIEVSLSPGFYRLLIMDEEGNSATGSIEVVP